MKRNAWYRFTFEDGFYVICMGMSPIKAAEYVKQHGKFTNKEFMAWDDELTTVGHVIGGDKNVTTCD